MAGPKGANMTAPATNGYGWTPTVANLVVIVALEIVAYAMLRWAFRTAHGG